jgi:predicted nucleotidyltransferase
MKQLGNGFNHGGQGGRKKPDQQLTNLQGVGCEPPPTYIRVMHKDAIIQKLREHRAALQALGVTSASLFGSTARGDDTSGSDIDIAVKLDPRLTPRGLAALSRIEEIERQLEKVFERKVDVIAEPARKERLQQQIDKDRAVAF